MKSTIKKENQITVKEKNARKLTMNLGNSMNWISYGKKLISSNRYLQILGGVFAVQVLMAVVLFAWSTRDAEFPGSDPVLSVDAKAVRDVEISDGGNIVKLSLKDDKWQITGDPMFPVQADRIDSLLNRLSDLKAGLPIASTVNAREQLDVADDDFQRRVTIIDENDEKTNLLIGSSSGLRKSHIRREGSDYIYSASLPVSDLPTSSINWLDKNLLSLTDITSVTSGEITFSQDESGEEMQWVIAKSDDSFVDFDKEKLKMAINTLTTLRVNDIWDGNTESVVDESDEFDEPDESVEADSDDTDQRLENGELLITSDAGESRLTVNKFGEDIVVESSQIPGQFTITESLFDALYPLIDPETLKPEVEAMTETSQ